MTRFRTPGLAAATALGLLSVASCTPAPTSGAAGAPTVVTAAATTGATPAASPATRPSGAATQDCDSAVTCYTPRQLQVAYGIKPLLDRGIDGRGETVVLPELAESAPNPPLVTDMRQDMAAFDAAFRLPTAQMRVDASLARTRTPWLAYGEEVLDVEMVHALAPGATLVILLLPTDSLDNTGNTVAAAVGALRRGSADGGVLSISAAGQVGGEHCVSRAQASSVHAAIQAAAARHATVVAASGDIGAAAEPCDVYAALAGTGSFTPVKEVTLLASDPLVLGVGGTSLTASHATGAWQGETAWGLPYGSVGSPFQASGGGFSRLFARPSYQDGISAIGSTRGVPDVSADASGHADLAMILRGGGRTVVRDGGGTSASAPIWAALIALASQYAGHRLGLVNPAIYRIAHGQKYRQAFHDITTGNNAVRFPPKTIAGYAAGPGWDPVTGWGSPDARILVPLLATYAAAAV